MDARRQAARDVRAHSDLIVRAALDRGVPVGAGGSRLLRGNHEEHEALEAEAAAYFGAESALFFGGGFLANTALLSTLPQRGDLGTQIKVLALDGDVDGVHGGAAGRSRRAVQAGRGHQRSGVFHLASKMAQCGRSGQAGKQGL